jgi:hypothetical protein
LSGNGLLNFPSNGSCLGSWSCNPLVDWPTGTRDGYDCNPDNAEDTARNSLGAMVRWGACVVLCCVVGEGAMVCLCVGGVRCDWRGGGVGLWCFVREYVEGVGRLAGCCVLCVLEGGVERIGSCRVP